MKKLTLLAAALGLVAAVHAQAPFGLPVSAIGYDANWNQVSARLPLGNANLDLGAAINYNDLAASDKFGFSVSGVYLAGLNKWGPVSLHLALGGNLSKPVAVSDLGLTGLAALQPEILLLDHVLLSTRFGAELDIMPDVIFRTVGQGVSIVSGASFKIVF
jgi:hypothetical protein